MAEQMQPVQEQLGGGGPSMSLIDVTPARSHEPILLEIRLSLTVESSSMRWPEAKSSCTHEDAQKHAQAGLVCMHGRH